MDAAKRAAEFLRHGVKGEFERGAPSNQHIIMTGAQSRPRSQPDQLAQAAPHPVALDGVADLFAHGKANPRRTDVFPRACLQDETAGMGSRAAPGSLGNGPKVTPAFQPLHCSDFGVTAFDRLQRYATETPSLSRSGTQRFAAARAPRPQNLAAAFTRHARAKAMAAFAHEFARLIGAFHRGLRCAAYRGDRPPRLPRLIREGFWPVNVSYRPFAGILLRSCDAGPEARCGERDIPSPAMRRSHIDLVWAI
jgi:hypothetical protein